jgi:hypothetical protein
MYVNDRILPAPGSLVTPVCYGSHPIPLFMVVAAQQVEYPGPWAQYELTLVGDQRLLRVDMERIDFHNDWHVVHRP